MAEDGALDTVEAMECQAVRGERQPRLRKGDMTVVEGLSEVHDVWGARFNRNCSYFWLEF